jgi:hypothetical protein
MINRELREERVQEERFFLQVLSFCHGGDEDGGERKREEMVLVV